MRSLIIAIMVAGVMPYVLTGIAKGGAFRARDNARTRDWQATLTGWRQRAYWAHLNAFEAFPLFAAAVLSALMFAPKHAHAPVLAWSFIGLRVAYGACFIGNWPRMRSLVWFLAVACALWLFGLAISGAGAGN